VVGGSKNDLARSGSRILGAFCYPLRMRLYEYSLRSRMFYASKAYPMQRNTYRRRRCTLTSSKMMSAMCSANTETPLRSYSTPDFAWGFAYQN
jgi:hypothetical protein